jgi:hypothetical protein
MHPSLRKRRGRQRPDVGIYCCTGCAHDKPTIRNGVQVNCSRCGSEPNDQLARLWNLPDWPVVSAMREVA